MNQDKPYDDHELVRLLQDGDVSAFEIIYEKHVDSLFAYAACRIDIEDSKEIVQEIFEWLWVNRGSLEVTSALRNYLFGMARNKILNYIRSQKIKDRYADHFIKFMASHKAYSTEELVSLNELEDTIEEKIRELPNKCQMVYRMSRNEHLSISNISKRMNISTRTVENYLTRALKHLRTSLGEFMVFLFWVLY